MREECKHYQSRTYASGEVARMCELDLAPEAPWRCPENCPKYERRFADAGWVHGTLIEPKIEEEPSEDHEGVARLLGEADDIVNAIVPNALAEAEHQRTVAERRGPGRRWPWRKRT